MTTSKKMENNLKKIKMEDDLKKMEHDLKKKGKKWKTTSKKIKMEDNLKQNAILTNSTTQHRQPDQHNNKKYIGTTKKINLHWL